MPKGQQAEFGTLEFQHAIGAYLGDVRLAPRLWHFIRRQIAQALLNAHEVYIADVGTFFFKLRPGRLGPTKWEDDRLILKFKPSLKFARQFHESQKRGRGKRLLEDLKKQPRRGDPNLKYTRVAKRQPTWYTRFGAQMDPAVDQLRQPQTQEGGDNV